MEKILKKVYYDLKSPACYSSPKNVLLEAKKIKNNITQKDVQDFLEKQRTYTLNRRSISKFKKLKTIGSGLHTHWQADLNVFDKISRANNGNKYILLCIDVLSRKIYGEPVKTKSHIHVIPAFEKIFKKAKVKPWVIFTDNGLEFEAKTMKKFFGDNDIIKYSAKTNNVQHASMAERANRTLKEKLYKYFSEKNTTRWVDALQPIIDSINNSVNRITSVTPNSVTFKNANILYKKLYSNNYNKKPRFKIGDIVRISNQKLLFSKGLSSFSDELFKIFKIIKRNPIVYKLKDLNNEPLQGLFYEQELCKTIKETTFRIEKILKTKIINGKKNFFVKWFGYDASFNSWITEDDLV